MKFRNFANKFLLVLCLVIFCCAGVAANWVPVVLPVTTADATVGNLTKEYYFNDYNYDAPSDRQLYDAVGIPVYHDYLSALAATQDLDEVVIAIVDSGLDMTHPVFEGRVLEEYAVDFSQGFTNTMRENWKIDQNGHGTHVAGLVADLTLDNVKILPIKVFDGLDNTNSDLFAYDNAVRYLYRLKTGRSVYYINKSGYETTNGSSLLPSGRLNNLVAVNLSLGTTGFALNKASEVAEFKSKQVVFQSSINYYLLNAGIMPISAAGNRASDEYDGEPYYCLPAACSGVLSVSAYDNTVKDYELANFSYYNEYVGVAAPGVEIWSACTSSIVALLDKAQKQLSPKPRDYDIYKYQFTSNGKEKTVSWVIRQDADGNYYLRMDGTSMATPFVSAAYALLKSDSSKTSAADYGLSSWDPTGADANFLSVEHKALLAAAANDGVGAEDGYDDKFGYGTLTVERFATDSVAEFEESIVFENPVVDVQTSFPGIDNPETEWASVMGVLILVAILVWGISIFKSYSTKGRKVDGDE